MALNRSVRVKFIKGHQPTGPCLETIRTSSALLFVELVPSHTHTLHTAYFSFKIYCQGMVGLRRKLPVRYGIGRTTRPAIGVFHVGALSYRSDCIPLFRGFDILNRRCRRGLSSILMPAVVVQDKGRVWGGLRKHPPPPSTSGCRILQRRFRSS